MRSHLAETMLVPVFVVAVVLLTEKNRAAAFSVPTTSLGTTRAFDTSSRSPFNQVLGKNTAHNDAAMPSWSWCLTTDHQRDCKTRLYMGWGPDPIWTSCEVLSNTVACPDESCVILNVKVSSETAKSFTIPGQYCQLRTTGDDDCKPIYLAMASAPPKIEDDEEPTDGDSVFEYIIKKTENNDWITSAAVGASLDISQVLGNGFAIKENFEGYKFDFPLQNIILAAAGTGIAPIKSAIESGQLGLENTGFFKARKARLYFGNRDWDETPYVDLFSTWEQMGVQVVPVMSDSDAPDIRSGYVQTAIEEDGVPIPRNSGALMCGMKGMTDAVRDLLVKAGVFEGRILTNY